ncbi:hypothetical protein BLA29_013836, partial [Euroglyphus maynei]
MLMHWLKKMNSIIIVKSWKMYATRSSQNCINKLVVLAVCLVECLEDFPVLVVSIHLLVVPDQPVVVMAVNLAPQLKKLI